MTSGDSGSKAASCRLDDRLVTALAVRVMGWTVGLDRFMQGDRRWLPRWRFRPTENLGDAFLLLEKAGPAKYSICGDGKGNVHVRVLIAGTAGEALGTSKALAITQAVARAIGVEVEP